MWKTEATFLCYPWSKSLYFSECPNSYGYISQNARFCKQVFQLMDIEGYGVQYFYDIVLGLDLQVKGFDQSIKF